MSKSILILHAKENFRAANAFEDKLKSRGFVVSAVGNLNRTQTDNGHELMRQYINDWDIIMFLVSQSIFNSCILSFGIGLALCSGKPVISVVKESDGIIFPSWYSNLFESHSFYQDEELWTKIKKF